RWLDASDGRVLFIMAMCGESRKAYAKAPENTPGTQDEGSTAVMRRDVAALTAQRFNRGISADAGIRCPATARYAQPVPVRTTGQRVHWQPGRGSRTMRRAGSDRSRARPTAGHRAYPGARPEAAGYAPVPDPASEIVSRLD